MLTLQQAAEQLQLSYRTVFRLVHLGEIKAVNVSAKPKRKVWRIGQEDLNAFIARRAVQTTPGVEEGETDRT